MFVRARQSVIYLIDNVTFLQLLLYTGDVSYRIIHVIIHVLHIVIMHARSRMILETSLMTSYFSPRDVTRDRARGATQQHATIDHACMHAWRAYRRDAPRRAATLGTELRTRCDAMRCDAMRRDAIRRDVKRRMYLLHFMQIRLQAPSGTILPAVIVLCNYAMTEKRYVRANEIQSCSTASTNWQREWKKSVKNRSKLREQLYDIHKNDVMEYFVSRFIRWHWSNPEV